MNEVVRVFMLSKEMASQINKTLCHSGWRITKTREGVTKKKIPVVLLRLDLGYGDSGFAAIDPKRNELISVRIVSKKLYKQNGYLLLSTRGKTDFEVLPQYRKKGVGIMLTAEAIREVAANNPVRVSTAVVHNKFWRRALIQKLGGTEGASGEIYFGNEELARGLWKKFLLRDRPTEIKPTPIKRLTQSLQKIFGKTISAEK